MRFRQERMSDGGGRDDELTNLVDSVYEKTSEIVSSY